MLKTKLGNIELNSCIYNASGVYCKTYDELMNLNNSSSVCIVLCKSCTVEPREGNPLPIYWDNKDTMSINSSGLPNLGYKFYINENIVNSITKPYIISISGLCENDNLEIVTRVTETPNISGIELNLSCPNVIGKSQIGYDFEAMDELLKKVENIILIRKFMDKNFIYGLKLPPYFDISHFEKVASIINKYSIDTITCINSLGNGLVVDPNTDTTVIKPKGGFGGIGGSVIKPIALANVHKFSELTNCDIIGCGGIRTGRDIYEHILCGAKAVQVGTQFYMENISVFDRLERELKDILIEKGYSSIEDLRGKLKTLN